MKLSRNHWLGIVAFIGVVVVTTALLVPQGTNPAYAVALDFVQAAGKGDDEAAMRALSPNLQAWVGDNCPEGSVSRCIRDYAPAEWGSFLNAVFRRAQPDGNRAWDIQFVASYAEGQGFSGVCIYARSEQKADESWHVVAWSGWVSCDAPNSGLRSLISDPSVPNRAP